MAPRMRKRRAKRGSRVCSACGSPALPGRATCSDACAASRHGVPLSARVDTDRQCVQCGAQFSAYRRAAKYCTHACRVAAIAARATPPKPCVRCGKQCPHKARKTCSPECQLAMRMPVVPGERRAKQRAAKKLGYRGKDRSAVVARLTSEQGGLCAVCGTAGHMRGDGKVGLVLDHCHKTGKARAMLCGRCNVALGAMLENPTTIEVLRCYAVWCSSEFQ